MPQRSIQRALLVAMALLGLAAVVWATARPAGAKPGGDQAGNQASSQASNQVTPGQGRVPVIVELYTSEGCSSCPPADALLARLARQQPVAGAWIVALGEHVDYWDSLGWRDRFSSGEFTARQSRYRVRFGLESNYTPQMVVAGREEFVGNNERRALQAVAAAAHASQTPLVLSAVGRQQGKVVATVRVPAVPAHAELYAALVDPAATTAVTRGENSGRRLDHVGVVRVLQQVHFDGREPASVPVAITPAPNSDSQQQLVVWLQSAGQGAVLGAAFSSLPQ
ncbi:MAG: DUF1223 domain-containing protein [Acidobacteriota bacterium]|nr:DUF1223 domain-containing protein [Acidobacteriota bacterium]